jgi:hypothetical protein
MFTTIFTVRVAFSTAALMFGAASVMMARPIPDNCYMIVRVNPFDKKCIDGSFCNTGTCTIRSDTTTCPGFTIFFCNCANTAVVGPDTTGDKCQTVAAQDAMGAQVMVCYDNTCGTVGHRGIEIDPSDPTNDCKRDLVTQPDTYINRCTCP